MIAESTTMIGELENSLGVPTFALFANWTGEYSVDVDEEAGRLLTEMMVQRIRRERCDEIALILGNRGGYPAFADTVIRTVEHLEVDLEVLVPCRIDGAGGLVAVSGDSITLHPQGGIGAVDGGLNVVPRRPLDAALFPHCPVEPREIPALEQAEESILARLANDRFVRHQQRRTAGRILSTKNLGGESMEWLLESTLGAGMTVGVDRLREADVEARVAPEPLAEQLEDLLEWAIRALQLYQTPEERFEVSDSLATEVEFEPAKMVPAAAIFCIDAVWLHELDTGSPEPDAPRLAGRWRRWNPDRNDDEDADR